jgi:hypothetical protein
MMGHTSSTNLSTPVPEPLVSSRGYIHNHFLIYLCYQTAFHSFFLKGGSSIAHLWSGGGSFNDDSGTRLCGQHEIFPGYRRALTERIRKIKTKVTSSGSRSQSSIKIPRMCIMIPPNEIIRTSETVSATHQY